jgi:purine-binding chemotaxis protein CheW
VGPAHAFPSGDYLTFRLGGQNFAMEASKLRAILPGTDLAPLHRSLAEAAALLGPFGQTPLTRQQICGFAVLQGRDVPVIDLRARLGLPDAPPRKRTSIVVVEVTGNRGPQLAGFVADGVSEVVHARGRDISRGKLRNMGRPRRVFDPDVLLLERTKE